MAGNITHRGPDSWRITYDVGRDLNGRRIRRTATIRGSYKDAERRLTELLSQRDLGFDVEPHRLTVDQFLARWLDAHNVQPQSRARYQQLIRRHISPSIGTLKLTTLKPLHLQTLLTEAEQQVSASTAHDFFTILHMAFAQAVRWQLLARNPSDALERPHVEETDAMRILTPAEIEDLLAAAEGTDLAPVIAFALDTGVRRGEALALKWTVVDLQAGTVEIVQSARVQTGVGTVYGAPKTRRSRRTIALSADMLARLKVHHRKQSERKLHLGPDWLNHEDLVFTNEIGEPLPLGSFNRDFTATVKKAGIAGRVRFHDLRHTHGTLMAQVANPKVVSDRLGHSDVKFTLNRYVNPTQDHQRQAAEALSALLRRAR